MSLRNPHITKRPDIWVVPSETDYKKEDNIKNYTYQIFANEELTKPRDITNDNISIVISQDYPYTEKSVINVKSKIIDGTRGLIEVNFDKKDIEELGEWKLECFITDGRTRQYSHHIDFNVVE